MTIWLAYLNDLLVDQDEDQRDLLHRCSDKYGYDTVVRSRTFRLEKGWTYTYPDPLPEPERIEPPPHIQKRMDRDTRPRDENGDLIDPQVPWKTAEALTRKARHLDGCSCRGCDHCECPCHQ